MGKSLKYLEGMSVLVTAAKSWGTSGFGARPSRFLNIHNNSSIFFNIMSVRSTHLKSMLKCTSPSWELELRPLGVATGNALSVTRV